MSQESRRTDPPSSPRRNVAGIGFVLLGAWFAWTTVGGQAALWLKVLLVVVGLGVAAYGAVQLVRARR